MFFCSLAFSEDFNLICEGERKVRNLSEKQFNVTNFESVLLKIKNDSMEYIGINSGRRYIFRNKEYTAPKKPQHEDIKIKELYEITSQNIKASHIITDTGNSKDSSITLIDLNIDLMSGKFHELESISNKNTSI